MTPQELATRMKHSTGADFENLVKDAPKDDLRKALDLLKDGVTFDDARAIASIGWANRAWIIALVTVIAGLLGYGTNAAQKLMSGAPSTSAAESSITLKATPAKAYPGQMVRLAAEFKGDVTWIQPDNAEWFADGKGAAVMSSLVPGDYLVFALAVQDGKPVFARSVITVEGARPPPVPPDVKPDPTPVDVLKSLDGIRADLLGLTKRVAVLEKQPPAPDPKPDPKPLPVVDKLNIVVVWESADSTSPVAGVMKDLAFWRSLEKVGVDWFQFDQHQPIVAAKGYKPYVDQHGLPAVVYLDKNGRVLKSSRLPATKEEIRKVVTELMGK